MRKLAAFLTLPLLLVSAQAENMPLAFPSAEGAGRHALGGRGGEVYHVTTLDDDGPGSLREGLRPPKVPRTIVFALSGSIELKSPLKLQDVSHITIAGQTAPGDGITLKDWGLQMKHASHIVIRYLRFRLGDENKTGTGPDVLSIDDCDHIILDHISASWGIDGIQDTRRCSNYTLQWSIFSEALHDSIHPKGPHAMCGSFREPVGHMSVHNNLFSTCRDRHPTLGGGTLRDPQWVIDFRNNVVYNWSGAANVCDNPVNLVNNYFRPGPESDLGEKPVAMKANLPDVARGHMSGNVFEQMDVFTAANYLAVDFERWLGPDSGYRYAGTVDDWRSDTPFDTGTTPATHSATEAYEAVLSRAGASLMRDVVDLRVVNNVRTRSGKLINSQQEVGGWPELQSIPPPADQDRDGMADEWEIQHGLNPADPEDRNGDHNRDGFTHLEEYLNSLCRE